MDVLARYSPRAFIIPLFMGLLILVMIFYGPYIDEGLLTLIILMVGYVVALNVIMEYMVKASYSLRIDRRIYGPVIEGRPIRIRVIVRNPSPIPILHAEISDLYPSLFTLVSGSNHIAGIIPARGSIEFTYEVIPRVGLHEFKGVQIVIRDPMGLMNHKIIVPGSIQTIKVHPRPMPLPKRILTRWIALSLGATKARVKGMGQEFLMLREYMPDDDYRLIDWKAFARHYKPYVKVFEREASLYIMIVLDAGKAMYHGVLGHTMLEESIRVVSGLAQATLYHGDWLGLTIRCMDRLKYIPLSRGRGHYYRVLEEIAGTKLFYLGKLKPRHTIEDAIKYTVLRIPKRAKVLFLIFTSIGAYTIMDGGVKELEGLVRAVRSLRILGHDVAIISPLPHLYEIKDLRGLEAGIYAILSYGDLERSSKYVRLLIQNGARVIQAGPRDLMKRILQLIEEYRLGTL